MNWTTIMVKDLLRNKQNEIWSVSPQATAYQALEIMAEKDVGALLVIENGELVGIFTERDYARKTVLQGRSCTRTPVSKLMTRQVISVTPANTADDCMAIMASHQFRHLAVLDRGRLIGILTVRDVIKKIMAEQEFTIHQLEDYVCS